MELGTGTVAGTMGSDGFAPAFGGRERGAQGGRPDPGADGRAPGAEPAKDALHSLTPAGQRRLILDLLRAGENDAEIGERFALTQWQVRNLRYRLGIKKERGGRIHVVEVARRPAAPAAPEPSRRGAPPIARGEAQRLEEHVAADTRMGVRLGGRLTAEEAGRRLTALGGLLSASTGLIELQVVIRQAGTGSSRLAGN